MKGSLIPTSALATQNGEYITKTLKFRYAIDGP